MTDTAGITAAAVEAAAGLRRVLRTDQFDNFDWADAQSVMPKLGHIGEQLADTNWTGPALLGDVFASLHKGRPVLHEVDEVARTHRVNRAVMTELMGDASWRQLREYTVGDTFGAGLAVATMADQLRDLYAKLGPAQEAADAAEAAQAELDEAEAGEAAEDALERLRAAAQAADEAADEALGDAAGSIGRCVRLAAGEAATEATDEAEVAAGWGLTPGQLSHIDPTERQRLAKLIGSDRMRRIAELVGRMRNMTWGEQSTRFDQGHDEIHDVVFSDNVARVVPSELVYLADPDLEDLFWLRYAERNLLTYELRSTRREAKGPIVYVEDSSLSMRGDREFWARATGLALLDIAIRQGRRFTAIVFSGVGMFKTFDFDPASRDTNLMLDYAGLTIGGGTDFAGPLNAALEALDSDLTNTGRSHGDIVFATDGEAKVSDEWLANWRAAKTRLGFTCYGIKIGGKKAETVDTICDGRVAEVHRLVDGDDTRDIFRAINTDTRN